jgi:hypothetical protein
MKLRKEGRKEGRLLLEIFVGWAFFLASRGVSK